MWRAFFTFLVFLLSLKLSHAVDGGYARPALVLLDDKTSKYIPPKTVVYHATFGRGDSLGVICSQGNRTEIWKFGSVAEFSSLTATIGNICEAQALDDDESVLVSCPLQVSVANLQRGAKQEMSTMDVVGWPFVAHPEGLCVWSEPNGNNVRVKIMNVRTSFKRTISLSANQAVMNFDISPDAKKLAIALNTNLLAVYNISANDHESFFLPLMLPDPLPRFPNSMAKLNELHPRFTFESFGAPNIVKFSSDGKRVAAANELAIHVWDFADKAHPVLLRGQKGRISVMAFSRDGDLLAGGEDKTIRLWKLGNTDGIEVAHLSEIPTSLDVRADGNLIAVGLSSGEMELWEVTKRSKVVNIHFFPREDGWVAVTPNGLFDSSEGAWQHLGWKFEDDPTNIVPIESFFQDFYQPGLLSSILKGDALTEVAELASLKPVLPEISLSVVSTKPSKWVMSPTGYRQQPERIAFRLEAHVLAGNAPQKDLQISHNSVVVRKWPGSVQFTNGICVKEFELEVFPWENRVAASVYTQAGIRSKESVWERPIQGDGYGVPAQILYVVAVGVSRHSNKNFSLSYSAADAQSFSQAFSVSSNALRAMSSRVMEWNSAKSLRLLGAFKWDAVPNTFIVSTLTNEQATHDGVLKLIRDTVSMAKPTDNFIFYFSGHGLSSKTHYFLVPYDAKMPLGMKASDPLPPEFDANNANVITDSELEDALLPLDVYHSALIIDACNSGKALKGFQEQALFDTTGLGRLAYEKGINILTASSESESAFESDKYRHSFLNHALIQEGIIERRADFHPRDGRIELREWLSYGAMRAEELASSQVRGAQHPQLAPRIIPEREFLVLWAADKEP